MNVDPNSCYISKVSLAITEKADVTSDVSEHTLNTVQEHFGFDLIVVYNAVDDEWYILGYGRLRLFDKLGTEELMFLHAGIRGERTRRNTFSTPRSRSRRRRSSLGAGSPADQLGERATSLTMSLSAVAYRKTGYCGYANTRGQVCLISGSIYGCLRINNLPCGSSIRTESTPIVRSVLFTERLPHISITISTHLPLMGLSSN